MATRTRTRLLRSRPARRGGLLTRRRALWSGVRPTAPWRTPKRRAPAGGLLGLLAAAAGVAVVVRGTAGGGGRGLRNRLRGSAREAMGGGAHVPVSDQDLVQHVRTNVLGRERWRPFTVSVDAADGVVTLRGQLDTESSIHELERHVAELSGVERVENLLHLPGEPAPNIVEAERASETARLDASARRSTIE